MIEEDTMWSYSSMTVLWFYCDMELCWFMAGTEHTEDHSTVRGILYLT